MWQTLLNGLTFHAELRPRAARRPAAAARHARSRIAFAIDARRHRRSARRWSRWSRVPLELGARSRGRGGELAGQGARAARLSCRAGAPAARSASPAAGRAPAARAGREIAAGAVEHPRDHHALARLGPVDRRPGDVLGRRSRRSRAPAPRRRPSRRPRQTRSCTGPGHTAVTVTPRPELRVRRLPEAEDEGLRRRVGGVVGQRLEGRHRGEVDDGAAAAGPHRAASSGPAGRPPPRR